MRGGLFAVREEKEPLDEDEDDAPFEMNLEEEVVLER